MTTAAIKQRITDIIKEGVAKAEAHYGRKFAMPTIVYTKGGARVAGTANGPTNRINLNPDIMMLNLEAFIERTPLHELAHLIDYQVNPENHQRGIVMTNSGRFKREKRDVHGYAWQQVAVVCGLKNPTRCHSYDTTALKRVKIGGGTWGCSCGCGKKCTVGAKIHNQLLANPSARWYHKGYPLVQLNAAAPAPTIVKRDVSAGVTTVRKIGAFENVTVVKSQDQVGSKLDQCWAIYKRNVGSSRGAIIQTMVSMANCTPAGAATYYATCKKRYESGVL